MLTGLPDRFGRRGYSLSLTGRDALRSKEGTAVKPIERVVAALRHEEADRVPVYPLLCGITRKLVGADYRTWATNADVTAEAFIQATDRFGLDCICTLTDLSVEAADFGAKLVWAPNEAACPDHHHRLLKDIADYRRVEYINPRHAPRMSEHIKLCDKLVRARGKDVPVAAFVFGPLGVLSMLRGQAEMFMDLYEDPAAVKAALKPIQASLLDYCDALIETGVHAIMLDTLFASQTIMSKKMWMEFEGDLARELAERIHSRGAMVMIHNCGGGVYFDVQIETMRPEAISFLHVPDDCESMEECKRKYGHKTTLIGAISPTWLPGATVAQVEAESRRQIDLFAAGGGFVLATGCEYPANMGFEAAEAIVRTAQTYGRYRKGMPAARQPSPACV